MEYLRQHFLNDKKDLSRLAIVFGGKRPALFVKQKLAQELKVSFFPPQFFSIDELVSYIVAKKENFSGMRDLEASYILYQLAKEKAPQVLKGRESFAKFLPWTKEVLSFIEQLDLEDIPSRQLRNVEANAAIGYPVPEDINRLLKEIVILRESFHQYSLKNNTYSRGFQYLRAKELMKEVRLQEFEQILFCNFFYFHRTEEEIIRSLYERDQAILLFQGDERKWPVLKRIAKDFAISLWEGETPQPTTFELKLYSGFDVQSQAGCVREILKTIKDLEQTVIVLPNAHRVIPLLSEIPSVAQDFNISVGYPLKRSSLYSLFDFIFRAQLTKRKDGYYTKDYLRLLRHPFVKNLELTFAPSITRILVHKIEEILMGKFMTPLAGNLFLDPEDLQKLDDLYEISQHSLRAVGFLGSQKDLKNLVGQLHELLFYGWEDIDNFKKFADTLDIFLETFLKKSSLKNYPLNINIISRIFALKDEFKNATFSHEIFPKEEIFKIFEHKLDGEMMSFHGSPLKGLQILGLFETRSLNFKHVIVMDTNEAVLPSLRIYEPLIPRDVMISLNLDRLEWEEEIQRYQFMRLISSAQTVHLIYQEGQDKEKSRFIEELIWEEQKKSKRLDVFQETHLNFQVKITQQRHRIVKTAQIIDYLRQMKYSASSVNMYLKNPLEFYYNYCLGLQEKEDLLDEPEAKQIGTFVHSLLENSFLKFLGKRPKLDEHFKNYFFKIFEERFQKTFGRGMKSDSFLLKSVLISRLNRFLDQEANGKTRQIKKILFIEKRFEDTIPLLCGPIQFTYRVDRIDEMEDGSILLIDYKTGSMDPMPKGIEKIESIEFSREKILENVISFQMPLYYYYLEKQYPEQLINAAFYNLRTMELKKFIDENTYERKKISGTFLRALDYILSEILNPEIPFEDSDE